MPVLPCALLRSVLRVVVLGVLMGCGGDGIRGVPVKGRVVKNGQRLQLRSGDTLIMYFVSTEEGRRIRSMAIYRPADGTFVCDGPTRHGVPKGRQRIELYPSTADFPPYNDYLFNNAFKGDNSPLEIELSEVNSQSLVIDVGAKTVTAP